MACSINSRLLRSAPCVLALTLLIGCQQYGSVSPRAYEIAKSLYSICNRTDVERIIVVERTITDSHAESAITDAEKEWLLEIVEKARAEDWTTAMQDARLMMMEQVEY